MSKKEELEYEEYEKLKNSKFKQQKLPGWRPVPSMIRAIAIFLSLGIVFAGLGVLILLFSNQIVEKIERYDKTCEYYRNNQCNITINITERMKANISVYYQLDGFYQNHPRYIRSKNEAQLKGEIATNEEIENDCYPIIKNSDVDNNSSNKLAPDDIAFPCGLMAKTFFNDTFTFYNKTDDSEIIINDHNIARKTDREKYKTTFNKSKHWINMSDEHFLVWMRPSPFPNFTKLYGRIYGDIEKGTIINVVINNSYLVESFDGGKYIVLRTVNSFGGKNHMLAIGYIIFGGVSIILGIIFIINFKARAKKEK